MDIKALALSATLATAFAAPALAQSGDQVKLKANQSDTYGTYVVDGEQRTLYLFTTDTRGKGGTPAASSCYDACAEAWPPLIAEEGQPQVGEQLDQELVGTFQRTSGETQVTYGGWPLYYFVKDQDPGAVNGQDLHGFGGEWYLVEPDGSKNEQQ